MPKQKKTDAEIVEDLCSRLKTRINKRMSVRMEKVAESGGNTDAEAEKYKDALSAVNEARDYLIEEPGAAGSSSDDDLKE
jgi:hypothetical protein